jgi:hypothetical protein
MIRRARGRGSRMARRIDLVMGSVIGNCYKIKRLFGCVYQKYFSLRKYMDPL